VPPPAAPSPPPPVAVVVPHVPPPAPAPPPPPPPPVQAQQAPQPPHYQTAQLFNKLDELSRELNAENKQIRVTPGAVTGLTTTLLSVGYVVWCLRGGSMVATLLTTMPLWRMLDPLPVLDRHGGGFGTDESDDEDEQKLRKMME
jgi:hypothetical protein